MKSRIKHRGFASMDKAKLRELSAKGGRSSQRKGVAHRWTKEEAVIAGRKGGLARAKERLRRLNIEDTPRHS